MANPTTRPSRKFINKLKAADSEKLIEQAYHEELRKHFPDCKISTPHQTDGYLEYRFEDKDKIHLLKLLIETKYQETFHNEVVRSELLVQAIYYLKKFEEAGGKIPNVILVGDKGECFVVHANYLDEYLDWDTNWNISPSSAPKENVKMVSHIAQNYNLQSQCFVHVIDDDFDFGQITQRIINLIIGHKRQIRLTEKNTSKVFEYFSMRILKRKSNGEPFYEPRKQVELFISLVLKSDDCFPHPKKRDKALFAGEEIKVNETNLRAFLEHYKFEHNAEEKRMFSAICDRLIKDAQRRFKGDFYTPVIWVDEAHNLITENLGIDWKENYMVWDCAWGTGNLTRDYTFQELYTSTLYEYDLEIGGKYNREAVKFQYDFLNDDVDTFDELLYFKGRDPVEDDFRDTKLWEKAPDLLRGLKAGKKLLIFINPPYGTAGEMSAAMTGKQKKSDIAKNKIHSIMQRNGVGPCSQQLYAQFLYRIYMLKALFGNNIFLGLYSPTLFMIGEHYNELRKLYDKNFLDGFYFKASEFADVKDNWCVGFTLWGDRGSNNYRLKILELNDQGVISLGSRPVYSLKENEKASNWVKSHTEKISDMYDIFTMSNALRVTDGTNKTSDKVFCWAVMDANVVEKNNSFAMILPVKLKGHLRSYPITQNNYRQVLSYYTARRLITGDYNTWVNGKDEYMIPDTSHPGYCQWENDCIVYSLFNPASNQSSLRNIEWGEKTWDIYNNLFFMSREEIKQLSLDHNLDETYDDIHYHGQDERFIYKELQKINLSEDAQLVLDKARELARDSFKYRELFSQKYPEYHISVWDASWYQIKGLLKEYMSQELTNFNQLYRKFEDRMRPMVVKLGFLYDYPGYNSKK